MNIIGYIHVCQRGNWKRSFTMLIDTIRKSNLYENINVIRIGVVNDVGKVIDDPLLKDNKFDIIYLGSSSQYERPTLLHMRSKSETDPENTVYFYLHTKGIKHFGSKYEKNIVGWIYLMLYWNIVRWQYALNVLKTYNIYGCDYIINHYSGNFWWATVNHIRKLPKQIESYYIAPEKWVTTIKEKLYCAYCSDHAGGGLYGNLLTPDKYVNLSNDEAYMTNLKAYKRMMYFMNNPIKPKKKVSMIGNINLNKTNINKTNINKTNIQSKPQQSKPQQSKPQQSKPQQKQKVNNKFTLNNVLKST